MLFHEIDFLKLYSNYTIINYKGGENVNYLVLATAAEKSGAKQVVLDYYNYAETNLMNHYIFLTSKIGLESKQNIEVIELPWIKKSLFHRVFFELYFVRIIIKKNKVEHIISLQNLALFRVKLPQTIIINQAIPFSNYKVRQIGKKIWLFKKVYGLLIKWSINKAQLVIVQANWLRDYLLNVGYPESKLTIMYPSSRFKSNHIGFITDNKINLFYPTSSSIYKNYYLIFDALKLIDPVKLSFLKLRITLYEADITKISHYIELINCGVLELVGQLNDHFMEKYYLSSILIFPSLIETFGYPLIEAREIGAPIIVADLPYSRDVLSGYEKVDYFSPTNPLALKELLESLTRTIDK